MFRAEDEDNMAGHRDEEGADAGKLCKHGRRWNKRCAPSGSGAAGAKRLEPETASRGALVADPVSRSSARGA